MNFVKRAWKYLQQNKAKKCMVGVMFICISLLFWGTKSMKTALNEVIDRMIAPMTAEVTVYREKGGMTSYDEEAAFPYECAEEVLGKEEPKSVTFAAEVNCFGEDVNGIIPDYELSQKDSDNFYVSEAEKKAGPLNLIGVEEMQDHAGFQHGKYEIMEGRGIEEKDQGKPYAVVSGRFLMRNRLKLGDTFTISSCFDRTKKETLKIIGVHSGDFVGTKSWESDCNYIYTPLENVYALNGRKVLRMQMELTDVKRLEKRIQRIEETGRKYDVKFHILKDNMEYLNATNPIESMKNMCDSTWTAVLLVTASILIVVNIFEVTKRKKEIGILISLGERRWKIAVQLLIEQLVTVLIGMGIGTIIWSISCEQIGTWVMGSNSIWNGSTFTYQITDGIPLLLYGVGLSLLIVTCGVMESLFIQLKKLIQE